MELSTPSKRITYTSGPKGATVSILIKNDEDEPVEMDSLELDVDAPSEVGVEPTSRPGAGFPLGFFIGDELEPSNRLNPSIRVFRSDEHPDDEILESEITVKLLKDGDVVDDGVVELYG